MTFAGSPIDRTSRTSRVYRKVLSVVAESSSASLSQPRDDAIAKRSNHESSGAPNGCQQGGYNVFRWALEQPGSHRRPTSIAVMHVHMELGKIDICLSTAVTCTHMELSEIDEFMCQGELFVNDCILIKHSSLLHNADSLLSTANPGVNIVIIAYMVMNISIICWTAFIYILARMTTM